MKKFFFWLDWPLPYRILYSLFLLVFLVSLAGLGFAFYIGDSESIFWTTQGTIDIVKVPFDFFEKHLFEFPIQTDAYLLLEEYQASFFQLNTWATYYYFGAILISIILIMSAISDLSLTYYGLGLAFVMMFIANMKLEILQVGGDIIDRWLLILAFLGYAPLSYLFFSFWNRASYVVRILAYSAVTVALVLYVQQETPLETPLYDLIAHSMAFSIIAVTACCLFIGHEVVRGILWMATNDASPAKQSTQRFLFLSGLYLANLIYGVAHLNYGYDLDIYYLHPVPLFILSLLIGVWGLRERAEQLHEIMAFAPTASFLYLGVGILGASSVAFSLFMVNEALLEVYQDIILHIHLGLAIAFTAYIYLNFQPIIKAGKKVYIIFYKAKQLPFPMAWIFGIALVFGLQFGNNFFIYDRSFAAYYTSLGDASIAADQKYEAKQYYQIAKTYDPLNYRLHYVLGSMAKEEGQKDAAYFFFEEGTRKNDTPQAYAQMYSLNKRQGFSFQALFDLKKGLEKHPNSGELLNNTALNFTKTDVADSAYLYFQLARERAIRPEIVESNLFSLWTKYDFFTSLDSIYEQWVPQPYVGTWGNELAFLSKNGSLTSKPLNAELLPDSILTTTELCYLYNYVVNTALSGDTSAMPILREMVDVIENEAFDLYLYAAMGHIAYQQGEYKNAFSYLDFANKEAGQTDPYYPYLIGLRYLEHEEYKKAVLFLEKAYQRGNNNALLPLAVATTELNDIPQAIKYWDTVIKGPIPADRELATNIKAILLGEVEDPLRLSSDKMKYHYLHYQGATLTDAAFDGVVQSMESLELQTRIIVQRIDFYIEQKEWTKAGLYLGQLTQKPLDDSLQPYFQQAYLKYNFSQAKFDEDFLSKAREALYPRFHIGLKNLYIGSCLEANGEDEKAIEELRAGIEAMPYNKLFYLKIAAIYSKKDQRETAYEVLLEGVEANPEDTELAKAYTLLCLDLGFDSYAEFTLQTLETLMTEAEYQAFEGVYMTKKAAMEKLVEDWQ